MQEDEFLNTDIFDYFETRTRLYAIFKLYSSHSLILIFRKDESCIFRLIGPKKESLTVLQAHLSLECHMGEMWVYTSQDKFGPFCHDRRTRRDDYTMHSETEIMGKEVDADEIDIVFKNSAGMQFSFSFHFDFEFYPEESVQTCSIQCIKAGISTYNIFLISGTRF